MSPLQTQRGSTSAPSPRSAPGVNGGKGDYLAWEDDADYVKARPPGIRFLRAIVALLVLVMIFSVGYRVTRSWFGAQLDPAGEPGEAVPVSIPSGATNSEIASILESKDVIPNATFFRYYVQWRHSDAEFQAGDYTLFVNSSADEAIAVLSEGPIPVEYGEFGVPEGLWISEMLPRIAAQVPSVTEAELQAVLDSGQLTPRYRPDGNNSWEGLLFPSTYFIEDDITATELLAKMSNEFASVTGELGYGSAERRHNLSAYEVVIIASLIQAEAKTDEDMAKISRVIYNRLDRKMPIEIDATFIYGAQDRQVPLVGDILETPGPYNSRDYNNPGLPPTPINSPGEAALAAAMNPADNPPSGCTEDPAEKPGACDWLYYVLIDTEGNHFFTHDYDEFINQRNLAREQGLFE